MKANKNHISLETAKLLKDCGVDSKYFWVKTRNARLNKEINKWVDWLDWSNWSVGFPSIQTDTHQCKFYPAYTWQEILWENADKFFGDDECECDCCGWDNAGYRHEPQCSSLNEPGEYTKHILKLLQQKKYKEADLYFREQTILIKEPPRGTKNMEKETLEELIEILESDIRIFGAHGDDLTRLNNLSELLEELEENEIS